MLKFEHVIGAGGLNARCFCTQSNLGRNCMFERKATLVSSVFLLMAVDVVQRSAMVKVALVESS